MYKNVIDPGKSVSFVLKDIDIGGQIQYLMCTGPLTQCAFKNFDYGTNLTQCVFKKCVGILNFRTIQTNWFL